jgi:nitroreductase
MSIQKGLSVEIKEALTKRRTIHNYLDEEIDQNLVKQALEFALLAPNHRFTFPWKFILIGKETREKIVMNMLDMAETKKGVVSGEELLARTNKIRSKIINPAALVAFVLPKNSNPFTEREDYASIACAIHSFSLALMEENWGSKWSTGKFTQHPKTYKLLDLDIEVEEIVGFVMVGHTATEIPARRRPNLTEALKILK